MRELNQVYQQALQLIRNDVPKLFDVKKSEDHPHGLMIYSPIIDSIEQLSTDLIKIVSSNDHFLMDFITRNDNIIAQLKVLLDEFFAYCSPDLKEFIHEDMKSTVIYEIRTCLINNYNHLIATGQIV